jgi:hypothetical protein
LAIRVGIDELTLSLTPENFTLTAIARVKFDTTKIFDPQHTGAYGTVSTCEGQILVLKLDRTNGSTSTIHSSVSSGSIDTLPLALDTLLSHVQLRSANLSQKTASRRFTISLKFGPHFNPQDFAFWG